MCACSGASQPIHKADTPLRIGKLLRFMWLVILAAGFVPKVAFSQSAIQEATNNDQEICPRPPAGSMVSEPEDLRSQNGVLQVDFSYRNVTDAYGQTRFCYLYKDGTQSPNLRLHPGDWLILTLKNELQVSLTSRRNSPPHMHSKAAVMLDPCANPVMEAFSTNLHFHGLTLPPVCHQDDVLNTSIAPNAAPFEYRFQIPADEPPGLYWYHPHIHGFTHAQVLGGASGALIIEGIERANRLLAGLPERVLILRDQELLSPDAIPANSTVHPPVLRDAEGDILNTGNGLGKPAKDLSVNFVPVPYPNYPPAVIPIKPAERQLWRILNASAITYVDLQILLAGVPQPLGVVALDGIPINEDGMATNRILWQNHVLLPPAGRIEFVFKGPPEGARATLITRSIDTGPAGENNPVRPIAEIVSTSVALEPRSTLPAIPGPPIPQTTVWLGNVKPAHERKLYFSEKPSDPSNPNSPTVFFLTVEGQPPVPFDPRSLLPNLIVQQGDVEDWLIENRTQELHAFHIHQIHFMVTEWRNVPIDEPFLRDTINVDYWDGKSHTYPSVKLRMDFRSPTSLGTFVYHCHLLEHEDAGMMGTIQVQPSPHPPN